MVSRQRQWQLKNRDRGLCAQCKCPRAQYKLSDGTVKTSILCEEHLKARREIQRKRVGSISRNSEKEFVRPKKGKR